MKIAPFLIAAVLAPSAVLAQAGATPSPLAPIYACSAETDAAKRLACFDAAVAALKQAEEKREVVAIDQATVRTLRREAFGFQLPSLPRLALPRLGGGGAQEAATADEPPEEMTFAVESVGRGDNGKPLLRLTNGQVWVLVDDVRWTTPRTKPFNVKIERAALGSYLLQREGLNRGWRVRRVQ